MKRITLLAALLFSFMLSAQNNTADTTFVNTPQVELDYYGNFDSTVEFPDDDQTYRQIIMTLKLGQYDCPPGEQYCHQWDYTTGIELNHNDEVYELGRFMTPFATSGWSRFGSDWQQPYIFDVTDYYPLLKGEKEISIRYEGYSGGFTAEIEFAFIEGTPEREVLGIRPAFQVVETYGDPNDPFNDHLTTFSDTTPEGTVDALMKVNVSGHGSDDTEQCCEFSSHYYDVILNDEQIAQEDIWRDDCGENDLYPQGGTWIYDRSNWCPGAKVEPIHHYLDLEAETEFDLDVEFEDYTGSGDLGNYNYNATVFYYGETYKETDAALIDIAAPTDHPDHFRANPTGNIPVVKVRNTGGSAITSIDFEYGVEGFGAPANHSWSGNLEPQQETEISLTTLDALTDISLDEEEGNLNFEVEIINVNGEEDEDLTNNYLSSTFNTAPLWPQEIVLKLKTGSKVENGYLYNSGASDISWKITDMEDNVIESRTDAQVNSEYNDTIQLPETGFYRLKIENYNCFGMHWWPYDGAQGYNAGYFKVTNENGGNLPMKNYIYSGTQHDDWGCSYTQVFSTDVDIQSVDKQEKSKLVIYPNPAKDVVNIDLKGNLVAPYQISLVDIQGRTVYQNQVEGDQTQIAVDQLNRGLYMVILKDNNDTKYIEKLIIGQ